MKILFTRVYGLVLNSKNTDIYKPITSQVFDNHTLGIRQVFEKYTTWYKTSLWQIHNTLGICIFIKKLIQTTSKIVGWFLKFYNYKKNNIYN
jgi:hypothetical protein